jgi:hypothetical protein
MCGSVLRGGEPGRELGRELFREGRFEELAFADGGIDDIWKASRVKTDMMGGNVREELVVEVVRRQKWVGLCCLFERTLVGRFFFVCL